MSDLTGFLLAAALVVLLAGAALALLAMLIGAVVRHDDFLRALRRVGATMSAIAAVTLWATWLASIVLA